MDPVNSFENYDSIFSPPSPIDCSTTNCGSVFLTQVFFALPTVILIGFVVYLLIHFCVNLVERVQEDNHDIERGETTRSPSGRIRIELRTLIMRERTARPSEDIRLDEVVPPSSYKKDDSIDCSCVICLEDFEEGERCRVLPKCNHVFHVSCFDPWFTSHHLTCPICRTSILAEESNS